jgi:hypothetical protein
MFRGCYFNKIFDALTKICLGIRGKNILLSRNLAIPCKMEVGKVFIDAVSIEGVRVRLL